MLNRFGMMCISFLLTITAPAAWSVNNSRKNSLTPEQARIIHEAIEHEKVTFQKVVDSAFIVQSYMQNMRSSDLPEMLLKPKILPKADQYELGRISSGDVRYVNEFYAGKAAMEPFEYDAVRKMYRIGPSPNRFIGFMLLDPTEFDQHHYSFTYIRGEFLGSIHTQLFDVTPKRNATGHLFIGRVWIEDETCNIVRFSGTYINSGQKTEDGLSYSFDSWRQNLQPNLWLPVNIYVSGWRPNSDQRRIFRARIKVWGYGLAAPTEAPLDYRAKPETKDMESNETQLSPDSSIQKRAVDRLVQAGLLSQPSSFDQRLEMIVNNVLIGNHIRLKDDIQCRILLTDTIESLEMGHTIILSKGLINSFPTDADLASVLSFQLAHILLGHQIGTREIFDDYVLFPRNEYFPNLALFHSDSENKQAASEAVKLLKKSVYSTQLSQPGLLLKGLSIQFEVLNAIYTPKLGDSLFGPAGEPWMKSLEEKGSEFGSDKAGLVVLQHSSNDLRLFPWDDEIQRSHNTPPSPEVRGDIALEITPIILNLRRYQPREFEQKISSRGSVVALSKNGGGSHVVRIFYATDRAPVGRAGNIQEFSGDRASSENLTFGTAEISIPPGHEIGKVEEPSIFRLRLNFDRNRDVVLLSAQSMPVEQFLDSLHRKLGGDPKKQVLIFIHGYDTTFGDAARRLGQITYDLGFQGAPVLYSWPSRGFLIDYLIDENNVEWSNPHFLKFLRMLRDDQKVGAIYVIGHSMGNRLITSGLSQLSKDNSKSNAKVKDVVMAAPDVDAGVFKQLAVPVLHAAAHITIYESSKDVALEASHRFHGYPRLGDTDPTVHVFRNYECIEATAVDTSFPGHSYIGNPSMLEDIFSLIVNQLPANERFGLKRESLNNMPYWSFESR